MDRIVADLAPVFAQKIFPTFFRFLPAIDPLPPRVVFSQSVDPRESRERSVQDRGESKKKFWQRSTKIRERERERDKKKKRKKKKKKKRRRGFPFN